MNELANSKITQIMTESDEMILDLVKSNDNALSVLESIESLLTEFKL